MSNEIAVIASKSNRLMHFKLIIIKLMIIIHSLILIILISVISNYNLVSLLIKLNINLIIIFSGKLIVASVVATSIDIISMLFQSKYFH